jgi:Fe-S-cluster formation regulator IscX/YfhJ
LKLNRIEKAIELYERAQTLDPKPDQMERLKNKIKELKEKPKNPSNPNPQIPNSK